MRLKPRVEAGGSASLTLGSSQTPSFSYQVLGFVDLPTVREVMGSSSASTTTTGDIYTDWDIDQLEEAMRQVTDGEER
jgi:hypothetical protein